jgi:hypothetical protein
MKSYFFTDAVPPRVICLTSTLENAIFGKSVVITCEAIAVPLPSYTIIHNDSEVSALTRHILLMFWNTVTLGHINVLQQVCLEIVQRSSVCISKVINTPIFSMLHYVVNQ